jgi:hypothetical protein
LASAALATFTILGGTAPADELTTESINQASATWMAPTLLGRVQERRGNDDGALHARKGADDGAGDDRGSDRRVARKGADDQPGDDRGGHGNDDGALHA